MRRGVLTATLVAALAPATCAVAKPYYSPGYKGKESFRNVTPAPLAPITVGTGKWPDLVVDRAGTAHVVFAQDGGGSAADTLGFCNLQRGIKTCATSGAAPNPEAPDASQGGGFIGNFPAGNHDFDGPAPLVIGNQLFVVDRRFPDVFPTPDGKSSDSNVFEWNSADGGATLTGPGQIGDNQMAGGAVAFGDPGARSIGTISRTETGGTFFQATPPGAYNTNKAQLGSGDQAYYGRLALDTDGVTPVAAFADLSGNIFVREWTDQGDPNDASSWTQASFQGFSPQIVGGPAGVFVLYSNSGINGGKLFLQRIVGGQPSGSPVMVGSSSSEPAISEDPTGRIAFAYTDSLGVWTRTSSNGVDFSAAQFTAAIPPGASIAHLATAATFDGGGFVSFVRDPVGAEGVGPVVLAAFGDQHATGQPGLGPLPGGGIGSAAGDQLATSGCLTAKFGVVEAHINGACFGHDPSNPNLDVTLGELNLNGLRIIPDSGTRIGIDPKAHTIDTTGKVRVVLSAAGLDITLWHDKLHVEVPNDGPGDTLFDFKDFTGQVAPIVEGFPVDGDVDVKLATGGVDIPISLTLPKILGGVTGSATVHASYPDGLQLSSLEFKVGDANLGALELKDVDVNFQLDSDDWSGEGELMIPAGGSALDVKLAVAFAGGKWTHGLLDVGLPYPGIPLDDSDPPPQVYLTHGGLDLRFDQAPTLTGLIGIGIIPTMAPGEGSRHDFAFSLDGSLGVSFGSPVTLTVGATGFLFGMQIENGTLTYKIPYQLNVVGHVNFDLGPLTLHGDMSAFVDARAKDFGAQINAGVDAFGHTLTGASVAVNKQGLAVYISPIGTAYYYWNDPLGPGLKPLKDITSRFVTAIPQAGDRRSAHAAAAASFTIPAGTPSADLIVRGADGAPTVTLTSPDGQQITPSAADSGAAVRALSDDGTHATYVGIQHPRAGRWSVAAADGSPAAIASVQYALGERPPTVSGTVSGRGFKRTLHYHASMPADAAVTFIEQSGKLTHVIGRAQGKSGAITFRPAYGPGGRRQVIAKITNNGLPFSSVTLGSYVAPPPPRPGRAAALRVRAGKRAFIFTFRPPVNAVRTLIRIVATDGRHLQQAVSTRTHGGSVPVIGYRDGITVGVVGLALDGARGPAVTASARRTK
jgi:hypothetical protein